MSEFDKICEECNETFSSYIETICDDCAFEHQEQNQKMRKKLTAAMELLKECEVVLDWCDDKFITYEPNHATELLTKIREFSAE